MWIMCGAMHQSLPPNSFLLNPVHATTFAVHCRLERASRDLPRHVAKMIIHFLGESFSNRDVWRQMSPATHLKKHRKSTDSQRMSIQKFRHLEAGIPKKQSWEIGKLFEQKYPKRKLSAAEYQTAKVFEKRQFLQYIAKETVYTSKVLQKKCREYSIKDTFHPRLRNHTTPHPSAWTRHHLIYLTSHHTCS